MDERCPEAKSLFSALESAIQTLTRLERERASQPPSTSSDLAAARKIADARKHFINTQIAVQDHALRCARCKLVMRTDD